MTGYSQLAQLFGSPPALLAGAEGDADAEGVGAGPSNGTHPASSSIVAASGRIAIEVLRALRPVAFTVNPFNDVCPNLHRDAPPNPATRLRAGAVRPRAAPNNPVGRSPVPPRAGR
ncbi:hypothetical protein GCM10017711_27790 [Paeniglutamicibacter sulfureus]